MAIVQQSMEPGHSGRSGKLVRDLRTNMDDAEELNQKIEEDKRREAWNQKIEKMINLTESFIQNPISSVKTPQRVTTKVPAVTTTVPAKPIQNSPCYDDLTSDRNKKITEKGVGKEGFGSALNKSKGSHLGLRHCAANRKRKKRKGPFVCTKSKSRVVIEVGQTEAIEGGLNCDNRLANYEQPCQLFLMFDYDAQEGEDPGITGKIMEQHLEDKSVSRRRRFSSSSHSINRGSFSLKDEYLARVQFTVKEKPLLDEVA
ncbi:hypothetical protein Tco_0483955 [Tanacetum coccineum]